MRVLPTVKSFLGCCDLKCSCIVIAAFRMVISIIVLIVLFVIFLVSGLPQPSYIKISHGELPIVAFMLGLYIGFGCTIIFTNIFASYCFILGATSNDPSRMKFYVVMEGTNIFLYVLLVILCNVYGIVFAISIAAMECYILICSNSLHQECLDSSVTLYQQHIRFNIIELIETKRTANIMVAIPTVKSFCGCCSLRVSCIVLASIRIFGYIAGVLAYLYFYVFFDVFKAKSNRRFREDQVHMVVSILFFVLSLNTFVSTLFIVGAKSKNASKLEYYLIVVGLNVILFIVLFQEMLAIFAAVDFIILFFSYSLYKEYSNQNGATNGVVYTTVNTTLMNENYPSPTSTKENSI